MDISVNANELVAAGHNYRFLGTDGPADFEDCDCRRVCRCPVDPITGVKGFALDGEMVGVKWEASAEWEADPDLVGDHRNRWFSSSEGLTDTTELSTPYWDEVAEAHVAEMEKAERLATPAASDAGPLHGAMEYWQAQRAQRADRLVRMAKRLAKARNFAKLATLKRGAAERYFASINLITKRDRAEWWMLYLTKEQMAAIRAI